MSWVDCVINPNYEIYSEYPYNIRKKSTKLALKINDKRCYRLDGKPINHFLIIAKQFIPNPNNYEDVELINKEQRNNWNPENLRWISKNKCPLTIQPSFEFELF